jgi:hypothetical protein
MTSSFAGEPEVHDLMDKGARDLLREILGKEDYAQLIGDVAWKLASRNHRYTSDQRMRANSVLNSWLRDIHVNRMSSTSKKLCVMHAMNLYMDMVELLR